MKFPKYHNADTCKAQILSENRNKSGIYKWTNLINGKQYIGSSINLSLSSYYSTGYMENALKKSISRIYSALLKNGHSNFSVTILEYCSPDKLLIREKHFIYFFLPEYNIIQDPSLPPFLGRNHSDETKQILSDANKGKTLSDETKKIISDALKGKKGKNHTEETKQIISEAKKGQPRAEGAGKPSQQIEVTDIKNNTRLLIILLVKLQ